MFFVQLKQTRTWLKSSDSFLLIRLY